MEPTIYLVLERDFTLHSNQVNTSFQVIIFELNFETSTNRNISPFWNRVKYSCCRYIHVLQFSEFLILNLRIMSTCYCQAHLLHILNLNKIMLNEETKSKMCLKETNAKLMLIIRLLLAIVSTLWIEDWLIGWLKEMLDIILGLIVCNRWSRYWTQMNIK